MLKDITLGQYFPGTSAVHRTDPRVKMLLLIVFIVVLFLCSNAVSYAICLAFILTVTAISKVPVKMLLKGLKPIIIIVIITAILNIFYTPGEELFSFWIFKVTKEGLTQAAYMTARIVLLIASTSLLTYTTTPMQLTDAIEKLLSPLKKIKVPVHEFAMMISIALRFIPTLMEETDKIMSAQRSRGADFESGNIIKRAKALIPILVPLFVSAFRRADELATAMECRLYHGGVGRTRLHSLKLTLTDLWSTIVTLGVLAAAVAASSLL